MKIKNLIVGGCSFTAGCGFEQVDFGKEDIANFDFAHEGLKKYFTEPFTYGNIRKQIEQLTYPALLGKKLKIENTKNLAVGGMGYPIHTRRIFSYLLNNQDKINLKETLVLLQLTSLQRAELPFPLNDNSIEYCYLGDGDGDDTAREYLITHYNQYYLILKGLYELSLFKGWCESMGVTFAFLDISNWQGKWIDDLRGKTNTINSINQHQSNLYHGDIPFADYNKILKDMNIIKIGGIPTFHSAGYHSDEHWSPEGHEVVAEKLFSILKEKFKINLDN